VISLSQSFTLFKFLLFFGNLFKSEGNYAIWRSATLVVRFGLANHFQQCPRISIENYASRAALICLMELQL
jgi:hypothetical protein